MTKAKDKYDVAVELIESGKVHPRFAWGNPLPGSRSMAARAHELFKHASPSGECEPSRDGKYACGCLTQIRFGRFVAYTPALTKAIRADKRIPDVHQLKPKHARLFAMWQRRIDKALGRT